MIQGKKLQGFLTRDKQEYLKQIYKKSRDAKASRKAHVILLLNEGFSYTEVARLCFVDEMTTRRYEATYKKDGVSSILISNFKESLCSLSEEQLQELKLHLAEVVYPTTQAVAEYVKKKYSVEYSSRGMTKLLKREGFVYKKPQVIPEKADSEAQKKFVEEYKKLKSNLDPDDVILSMDGTHPAHNSKPAYGWFLKGKTACIKSNTGRKRININGAISLSDFSEIFRAYKSINAESTIDLLKAIEALYPKAKRIYIKCDNARYYRSKMVMEFLKTSKIILIFLPTYSPNLNLIERLWKFFHEKVTNNRYYEKFEDFELATMGFFENLSCYKKGFSVRLKNNFQIIDSTKNLVSYK